MCKRNQLRPLLRSDYRVAREIYADAIESQGPAFYDTEQIQAWSALAWIPGVLDKALEEGVGWLSVVNGSSEAFALRYPSDRLALLYCRGRSSCQGHATALLNCIENEAKREGKKKLITEASLFSYQLLLKRNWYLLTAEKIEIAGIPFKRYKMEKSLNF